MSGLMFVDDLNIFYNSIEGLVLMITIIISKAREDDLVINLVKSALCLNSTQEKDLNQLLTLHPILRYFENKSKAIFLGAITSPNKPATYHHTINLASPCTI
jgi:hypothetical protein